jgi:peptidoglycan-associated lipoprotein
MYNFLFGPSVSANAGRLGLFGHALFGESLSRLSAGISVPILGGLTTSVTSANSFAMAFGGGVDIGLTRHIALRAGQFDYLRTQFTPTEALANGLSSSSNGRQNSFRYAGGIVFRF